MDPITFSSALESTNRLWYLGPSPSMPMPQDTILVPKAIRLCTRDATSGLVTSSLYICFFQCKQVVSCPVSDCQCKGSGRVFFNHQFFVPIYKIPWSLLFSSLNNHISFSPYMRCFCYLIILMALKSSLKESVFEVVNRFLNIFWSFTSKLTHENYMDYIHFDE